MRNRRNYLVVRKHYKANQHGRHKAQLHITL